MNEHDLHSVISASEAPVEAHEEHNRSDRAFGAVVALSILAAIILRLAAAELVPGWVIIPVLCIAGVLYGCGLRQLSDCRRYDDGQNV